ncbi:MAG: class I SAM-dependent methyltransferase [Boseongicola sp.]|nr:class I SAM-dependent methyltransferase [Boseongicola sp.]
MFSDRLRIALETGLLDLPEDGPIAVVGPSIGDDLGLLPSSRVVVVQRRYPAYLHFERLGYQVIPSLAGEFAMSFVCVPRARAEAELVLAHVSEATDGPVVIDGQKTDGIGSYLKLARQHGDMKDVVSKSHGKLAIFENLSIPAANTEFTIIEGKFQTGPGVFSADGIDPASRLLADALPDGMKGSIADFGAGWGYLSSEILERPDVTSLDVVEADFVALSLAKTNVTDARARFHWADVMSFEPDEPFDHVVMNPPFHTGRAAEVTLGQDFIRAAARTLKPRGELWLVANRHLPYEKTLEDVFHSVKSLGDSPSFKIFHASSPKQRRKGM